MSRWEQVKPHIWHLPATKGWVVYVENNAHYFAEDQRAAAQAVYDAAKADGKWASKPMPAYMGQ